MLSLALLAALSQNPNVAVVQSSNLGVPPKRADELTALLVNLLKNEKLAPNDSTKTLCDSRTCLVDTGKKLGAIAVVSVALASLGKDTVMDLECITVSDGKSIAQTTFTSKPGEAKLPFEAASFAADVWRVLAPLVQQSNVAQNDAPKPATLTPEPKPAQPELVTQPSTGGGSKALPIVLGAGAIVAGVISGVLFAVAQGEKPAVRKMDPNDPSASAYTHPEAVQLRNSVNAKYTTSLVMVCTAGALAAGSVITLAF